MSSKTFLSDAFEREVQRSRRALEQLPDADPAWKPHERSMALGYLAELVATIPTWVVMQLTGDELDVFPEGGSKVKREPHRTRQALLDALDEGAGKVRQAFDATTDEHLDTEWRLKARGQVVQSHPRRVMIQDSLLHWAHHRGQLTVYLRMLGATVPALYGPSADDQSFGPS